MRTRWPARTGDSSDASLTGDRGEGGPRPSSQAMAMALTGVDGDAIGSGGDAFVVAGGGGGDEEVVGGGGGTSGSGSGGGGARAISPDDMVTTLWPCGVAVFVEFARLTCKGAAGLRAGAGLCRGGAAPAAAR